MTVDPNRYAHPVPGLAARLFEALANSTALAGLRRATAGRLPFTVLASDVVNVVYATWLMDAAVALVPSIGRVAMATIDLPVDVARVEPLRLAPGSLDCPLLDTLGARGEPLCYHLPAVRFRALSEKLL